MSMVRGGRPGANIAVHDRPGMVGGMADGLLNRLRPQDRVLLMRFAGHQGWTLGAWSEDRAQNLATARMLLDPVDPMHVTGPSPIWDAVASAARLLESQPGPRAIVLVTDGHATGNRLGVADAAAEAAQRGVRQPSVRSRLVSARSACSSSSSATRSRSLGRPAARLR